MAKDREKDGAIAGSIHIPITDLADKIAQLPERPQVPYRYSLQERLDRRDGDDNAPSVRLCQYQEYERRFFSLAESWICNCKNTLVFR
jgi:hypothetical protein